MTAKPKKAKPPREKLPLSSLADGVAQVGEDLAYALEAAEQAGVTLPPDLLTHLEESLSRALFEFDGYADRVDALLPHPSSPGRSGLPPTPGGSFLNRHAKQARAAGDSDP